MLERLQQSIRQTAQRFALGGIGALMAITGIGFLTASALMLLLTLTDPMTACAIMGGGFLGVGLIMTCLAAPSKSKKSAHMTHATKDPMPPIATAFMQGVAQGMAARQSRR